MASRTITLRAFLFTHESSLTTPPEDLLAHVRERLGSTCAENREMPLNQEDETRESDLLSGYEIQENNIFATMMRIAPGADDTHIDETLMKKRSFSVGEMKRFTTTDRAIYKSHYYICLDNNFLVTTLPRTTNITRVETYINWFLNSHKYSLVPVVIPTPNVTLAELNTITFKPQSPQKQNKSEVQSVVKSKWLELSDIILCKIPELLFGASKSLSDIEWESVISAELVLKIKGQSKLKNEEFQKIFGSLLKPVTETDHVILKNKNGESIKGSEIIKTKRVKIEVTDSKFISEPKLHQEMARFLDELAQ